MQGLRFSLFQVFSAYTNSGFSLVDQSMTPFRTAYVMIIPLFFVIIAGNTGYVSSISMSCLGLFCVDEVIPTTSPYFYDYACKPPQIQANLDPSMLIEDYSSAGSQPKSSQSTLKRTKLFISSSTTLADATSTYSLRIKRGSCSRSCSS